MHVPVIHLERVYHVGTMDPARLGSTSGRSLEGHCLSVSLCPNAWVSIARLGGNRWHALDRPRGSFLDVHAVLDDPDLLAAAVEWAVDEGLAERAGAWRLWRHDDEAGSWGYMTFATEDEALAEADPDGDLEGPGDVEGPGGRPGIEAFPVLRAMPALCVATGMRLGPADDATDAVLMQWARTVADGAVPGGIDGVWWRETLDPEILSAPRAGIFPERVAGWSASPVPTGSVDDGAGTDAMPEPVRYDLPSGPTPR